MDLPSHIQKPKLCTIRKWETFAGYGFNLHSEKGKLGQFIGKVDPNSPADHGGLKPNDVLIEVNGINVEDSSHSIVVGRVKSIPDKVEIFVCHPDTNKYCKENGIKLSSAMHNIEEYTTPLKQPSPTPEIEQNASEVQASLLAAVESAGGAEYEEVKQEDLPKQFRSQRDPQEEQRSHQSSPSPVKRNSTPPPSFTAPPPAAATAAVAAAVAPAPAATKSAAAAPAVTAAAPPPYKATTSSSTSSTSSAAASKSNTGGASRGGGDPIGSASLDEVRSRIGQNKRNQVKMESGTFSEKYSIFQSL